MSRTKRYLHLVEMDSKRIAKTYEWQEHDQDTREDDPFNGSYPQNLISGRTQAQSQCNKTTAYDSNTTLPEAR